MLPKDLHDTFSYCSIKLAIAEKAYECSCEWERDNPRSIFDFRRKARKTNDLKKCMLKEREDNKNFEGNLISPELYNTFTNLVISKVVQR